MTLNNALLQSSARPASRGPGRRLWALVRDPDSRLRRHPALLDGAIAAIVAGIPLLVAAVDARPDDLTAVLVAACVAAYILLFCRRRWPVAVLVLATAGSVVSIAVSEELVVLQIAAVIAVYTVSSTTQRATAWTAGVLTALALLLASWLFSSTAVFAPETLATIAWFGMATAAGDAVRNRRAYIKAVEERAERAERILEEEGMRRVAEERLRIARDLHDVVAHHIAVINVQAGVASHLLRTDPDGATAALAHVRQGGRSVLDELGTILRVLRRPDGLAAPVETVPTLDQLDELIKSFQESGLEVEWRSSGEHRPLSPAVEMTGYRVVQESLTNAHKHGSATGAKLRLDYSEEGLSIEVLNRGASDGPDQPGHGIAGMRERVEAVGGTIDVGRAPDGRFRVHATLPVASQ